MRADALAVEVRVTVAWWLRAYLTAAVLLHRIGVRIDFAHVRDVIDRAITLSVGGSRPTHVFSNRPA